MLSCPHAAATELLGMIHMLSILNRQAIVGTGLAMTIPENCYGRIAPRSSLAVNYSIDILAGIADRDYTGEYKVVMFNHGETPYTYDVGDRIAQLIIEQIATPDIVEVEELSTSNRGCTWLRSVPRERR